MSGGVQEKVVVETVPLEEGTCCNRTCISMDINNRQCVQEYACTIKLGQEVLPPLNVKMESFRKPAFSRTGCKRVHGVKDTPQKDTSPKHNPACPVNFPSKLLELFLIGTVLSGEM